MNYGKKKIIRDHAAGIKDLWGGHERQIVMDPMAWKKHQIIETEFRTIADRYREHGVPATVAPNDMMPAIDLIRELHEPDPEHKHPITGQSPAPYMYFFRHGLPNFFEELRSWMVVEPDKEPCHQMDNLRYSILSRLTGPARRKFHQYKKFRKPSFMGL